jgi:hypothetical protein
VERNGLGRGARKANLTVRAMRLALKRPHVLKYLRAERGVLLASASGQNLKALATLRDQTENRAAAVQAARTLEGLATEQFEPGARGYSGGRARAGWMIDISAEEPSPGVVIIVGPRPEPEEPGVTIDVTPNRHEDPPSGQGRPAFKPR